MSFSVGQRPQSGGKIVRQKDKSDSALKILPPENGALDREDTWESVGSQSSGRKSSSSKRAPPVQKSDSYTSRRTPTPSKQVSLQMTRRKDLSDEQSSFGDLDWEEHERLESARLQSGAKPKTSSASSSLQGQSTKSKSGSNNSKSSKRNNSEKGFSKHRCSDSNETQNGDRSAELMLKQCYKKEDVTDLMADMGFTDKSEKTQEGSSNSRKGESSKGATAAAGRSKPTSSERGPDIEDSDEFDTDLEDREDSSSDSETEEKRRAPDELKLEFLSSVMGQQWQDAQRLCQMILIYEPDHEEANSFKDLIAEKIQLEAELAEESGSDYETDDDDDDDDDDSSDEDSDEDTEESSDSDEDAAAGQQNSTTSVPDSGISSATDLHQRY